LADSLLSVHIGPDFHQVFQYQGALSRIVSYYDFNTLLGETFSDSTNILNKEHIFVQYRLKRADGKPIKMYTLTMSFDSTDHENTSPILYDSLDFAQLRYMYNVLSQDSLLSKKEAIAKLHEQLPNARYDFLLKKCIYNSLTHRFEWILDGDIVIKQKTASKRQKSPIPSSDSMPLPERFFIQAIDPICINYICFPLTSSANTQSLPL
jgi:hypothetical protein